MDFNDDFDPDDMADLADVGRETEREAETAPLDFSRALSDEVARAFPDWQIAGAACVVVAVIPDGMEAVLKFSRGDLEAAADALAELSTEASS